MVASIDKSQISRTLCNYWELLSGQKHGVQQQQQQQQQQKEQKGDNFTSSICTLAWIGFAESAKCRIDKTRVCQAWVQNLWQFASLLFPFLKMVSILFSNCDQWLAVSDVILCSEVVQYHDHWPGPRPLHSYGNFALLRHFSTSHQWLPVSDAICCSDSEAASWFANLQLPSITDHHHYGCGHHFHDEDEETSWFVNLQPELVEKLLRFLDLTSTKDL